MISKISCHIILKAQTRRRLRGSIFTAELIDDRNAILIVAFNEHSEITPLDVNPRSMSQADRTRVFLHFSAMQEMVGVWNLL